MARNKGHFSQDKLNYDTFIIDISDSTTVSDAVDLVGATPLGLIMPATFSGTAMTFQVSHDGTTYYNLYNTAGLAVSITVGTSRYIGLLREDFEGFRFIKCVSGTAEGADRTLIMVLGRQ